MLPGLKKVAIVVAMLLTLTGLVCAAQAGPYLTNGQYEAYLGENNHLFIRNSLTNELKNLPTAIEDIVSMNATELYCLAKGGALYGVMLDGSGSRVIAAAPTEQELSTYRAANGYTLENGTLTIATGAMTQPVSGIVAAACTYGDWLYYAQIETDGITIKRVALSNPMGGITVIGPAYMTPTALCASNDKLIVMDGQGNAIAYQLQQLYVTKLSLNVGGVSHLALVGDTLYCYQKDPQTGYLLYSGKVDVAVVAPPTLAPMQLVPETQLEPNYIQQENDYDYSDDDYYYINPTPKPTKRPASPTTPPSSSSGYAAVSYGSSGTRVYNMQKRLKELGYPVGTVDSYFGNNTLRALHLFQEQAGYYESGTASSNLLSKLYGKNAPSFDLFKGRQYGNAGERVRMLQERLRALKYYEVGTVDGSYGSNTSAAITHFQKRAGLKQTGVADRETMRKLYSSKAPKSDGGYPDPGPGPEHGTFELKRGDISKEVYWMKKALVDMGYMKQDPLSKEFDKQTEDVIKSIQKKLKLKQTGKVGLELYKMIINQTIPKPATDPEPPPKVT